MKLYVFAAGLLLLISQAALSAEGEDPREFNVIGFSASDPDLELLGEGANCAEELKELQSYEQYRIINAVGFQGPPGVLYTLEGPRGDMVILKCGQQHEEEPGGGEALAEE